MVCIYVEPSDVDFVRRRYYYSTIIRPLAVRLAPDPDSGSEILSEADPLGLFLSHNHSAGHDQGGHIH